VKRTRSKPNDASSSASGSTNTNESEANQNDTTETFDRATISIELSSNSLKKEVMLGKKSNYKKLNAAVFNKNDKSKIYINETLSSYFRALYTAAKELKKREHIKFLWFKNSRILLRKDENSKVVIVRSFEDLNNIKQTDF